MLVKQRGAAGRSSTDGRNPDPAWVAAPGEVFPTDAQALQGTEHGYFCPLSAARSPGVFLSQRCHFPQGQVSSLCPIPRWIPARGPGAKAGLTQLPAP